MIYNTFYYEKKLKNVKTNPVSAAYHRVEYKPNHLHIKKAPPCDGALKYFVQRDITTSIRSIINYAL